MNDKRKKTNGLELPAFDPRENAVFATKALGDLKIKCVSVGKLAVWYWLPDPALHAYSKDLDTAIRKTHRQKAAGHLAGLKYGVKGLVIGGINVHGEKENIKVDFIDRYSVDEGDLSKRPPWLCNRDARSPVGETSGKKRFALRPVRAHTYPPRSIESPKPRRRWPTI